uniref:Uncharacterized protein n=1 Tax=viral metagenome TaxID=1070528 RepID=A0A6M3LZY0_9ZZZZ
MNADELLTMNLEERAAPTKERTAMSEKYIHYRFNSGNLFGDDVDGIDQGASVQAYAGQLREALAAQYPSVEIEVDWDDAVGCGPFWSFYLADSEEEYCQTEDATRQAIESVASEVWEGFKWIQET